jgi:Spx/MgsR family transcriptional regulator
MPTTKRKAPRKRAASKRTKRVGAKVRFLHKPSCTTCRKARSFMERHGFQLYFRDLAKEKLSSAELEKLIGPRDYTQFLNPRNELYRRKHMKDDPPSRSEAIRMMAKEPNWIRRPVIVGGGRVVIGFDRNGMAKL